MDDIDVLKLASKKHLLSIGINIGDVIRILRGLGHFNQQSSFQTSVSAALAPSIPPRPTSTPFYDSPIGNIHYNRRKSRQRQISPQFTQPSPPNSSTTNPI